VNTSAKATAVLTGSPFDTQVSVLGNQALVYLVSGMLPPRMGNEHTSIVPGRSRPR
jgi:crotonobetainyl-CoA:carnitine CoA-transferase CaiB-like acyl-CoA transferase